MIDQLGAIAPLKEMPDHAIGEIKIFGITGQEALHEFRKVAIGCGDVEMKVIGEKVLIE